MFVMAHIVLSFIRLVIWTFGLDFCRLHAYSMPAINIKVKR